MAAVCARRAAVTLHVDMVLATECTTLALELIHAHSREGGGAVVTGSFVVDFVDGDGSVDDLGLNGLFLNDGLDFLVDVMMYLLALHNRGTALRVLRLGNGAVVPQLGGLGLEGPLGGAVVAVVELAVDDILGVVDVLLGEDLAVLDGLDDAVVVVLVHLLLDCPGDLLVACRLDRLVCHGRGGFLGGGGVVVPGVGHEVPDGGFGAIHGESVWWFRGKWVKISL